MVHTLDGSQVVDSASIWAQQVAEGNRTQVDQLAAHIRILLRKRFLSLGLTPDETDDLVQECSALVFSAIDKFDSSKGSLDAWVSGYARNLLRSWWRGEYARRNGEMPLDSNRDIAVEEDNGLTAAALEAAMTELNPIDQELLQMRFGFGYSFEEIADMANIPAVNARKRVSRAVEALRKNPVLRVSMGFAV